MVEITLDILLPLSYIRVNMKLHSVTHGTARNRYCGPSALSIITGIDTGRAAALLRKVSGKRAIRGVSHHHMTTALNHLGVIPIIQGDYSSLPPRKRPTLNQWARRKGGDMYLVSAGHHYQVIQGRRYCCSLTKKVVPLKQAPHRRARVKMAWKLTSSNVPVVLDIVAPAPVRKVDTQRKDREEAKRLARANGVEIEVGNPSPDCIYVWCPQFDEDNDPYEGDHYVYDWSEALERVKGYVDAINARFLLTVRERDVKVEA
jgi:hypothetical protein